MTGNSRPAIAFAWAVDTFGALARLRGERRQRFIEEAIELVHADDMTRSELDAIVDRVYSRERGHIPNEIGQTQICLEVYAESIGESADHQADVEFARVQSIPKVEWERRQNAKAAIGIALPIGAVK